MRIIFSKQNRWSTRALTVCVGLSAGAAQADVTLSNITAAQRPGTKLMDITYDVSSTTESTITVSLSVTNGTDAVACPSVTGSAGNSVPTGTGKQLVWDMGADWNGSVAALSVTLTADDRSSGGGSSITDMVQIPAGSYLVNNPDSDFFPYTLNVGSFNMDTTEITKTQWDTVYDWAVANGYSFDNAGLGKALNHPVHTVNWYDSVKWCNARSEMEGKTPVYTVSGNTYRTGQSIPTASTSADGYRLPTSDEWEHAARGGLSNKRFPWGDTITHNDANYYSDSQYSYDTSTTRLYHPDYDSGGFPFTSPAGSFPANGYGLHDMAGNLTEYCFSFYRDDYTATDYVIIRGGCWGTDAFIARCGQEALALHNNADTGNGRYGFRTICNVPEDTGATGTVTQDGASAACDTRNYTLEVVAAHGTPAPSVGVHADYCWQSTVTCSVENVASDGWMFMGWTGDAETDYTQTSVTVLMDSTSKSVEALFSDDADGDGLLNTEEVTLTTDPRNPDTDGDQMNDYDEGIAGTSPTDPSSVLAIDCQMLEDGTHQLSWHGISKHYYTVQYSDSLLSGWQSDSEIRANKSGTITVPAPNEGSSQFYRVIVRQ